VCDSCKGAAIINRRVDIHLCRKCDGKFQEAKRSLRREPRERDQFMRDVMDCLRERLERERRP
jgi:hypothetical protein